MLGGVGLQPTGGQGEGWGPTATPRGVLGVMPPSHTGCIPMGPPPLQPSGGQGRCSGAQILIGKPGREIIKVIKRGA